MESINQDYAAGAEALPLVEIRMQRWATVTCSSSDGMNHIFPAERIAGKTYKEGIIESLGGVSISVQGGSVHGELQDAEGRTVAETVFVRRQSTLRQLASAHERPVEVLIPHAAIPTLSLKQRVKFGSR